MKNTWKEIKLISHQKTTNESLKTINLGDQTGIKRN